MENSNGEGGVEYTTAGGVLMTPLSHNNAWDVFTMFFAMAIPFIALRMPVHSPFPIFVLDRLMVFQIMTSRNLLSYDQLRALELLLAVLIAARIAGSPAFLGRYAGKPPPDAWRTIWPRQVCRYFLFPAIGISLVLFTGLIVRHGIYPYYLTGKGEMLLLMFALSICLWFLIDSMFAAVLCSFFYFRYWRHLGDG